MRGGSKPTWVMEDESAGDASTTGVALPAGGPASSLESRREVQLPVPALAGPVVGMDEVHFRHQEAEQVHAHRGAVARHARLRATHEELRTLALVPSHA